MKVLSHEGSRARKLNALHESMVCAAVHHPNVVRACAQRCRCRAAVGCLVAPPGILSPLPRGFPFLLPYPSPQGNCLHGSTVSLEVELGVCPWRTECSFSGCGCLTSHCVCGLFGQRWTGTRLCAQAMTVQAWREPHPR